MASRRTLLPGAPAVLRNVTRREWTTLFAAVPLMAQTTQTPASAPQPLPPKGIADVQKVSQRLAEIDVPMNVEPCFHFTA